MKVYTIQIWINVVRIVSMDDKVQTRSIAYNRLGVPDTEIEAKAMQVIFRSKLAGHAVTLQRSNRIFTTQPV